MSSTGIDDIIKQLTLEEKSALLAGATTWTTVAVERLGIPPIMMTDGPHGLRKAATTIAGNKATCFPTASALAATWNKDMVYQVAAHIGREAQSQDVQVVLGPGINLKRSPLGGRNFEYYSEDPVLSGELGVAFVNGLKSVGVGASIKHFAANSQEYERMTNSSEIDQRTLHELYLKAFRKVVRYSQPWSVMAAYNKVNGEYATRSHYLLTEGLRDQWGFGGIVVSDWGAAALERVAALQAGLDLEMPGGSSGNEKRIAKAVEEGKLKEAILDASLKRLIPHIQNIASQRQPDVVINHDTHHQFAREVASEAIVLLKNKDNILPITPASQKKIAVIGRFAKTPRFQGAGSSQVTPTTVDTLYDSLVDVWGKDKVVFSEGYTATGRTSPALLKKAKAAVKTADVAIVAAGLPAIYETEGLDRKTLDLPEGHITLINELSGLGVPMVVALTNGSAVSMPWLEKVDAVVEGWLGGQAGAGAMADVLTGAVNPSGKLSETFPLRIEDTPAFPYFPSKNGKAIYGEGIFIGYRHLDIHDIKPLFPFGFGLSYTTFSYSDLKMSKATFKRDESVILRVTVKNTGKRSGKEVAQLYIGYHNSDMPRAIRELKN
ncbi:MAG TPA: glycoside hydrolase family 3 C-terminal domain-containing protein, partial [Candidatus Saccharibacteria bacterium]|nr:glycoside hydrolase family 3 C-terminal domain-containing protein [Candidatus Saccharibacteria bacterium]